ncbi:MAG: pentapeptide repeat-containing protein, partial [Alphaproteobacteria bacterium]|nr:pentapeptide repeat-containing protein [Alphaproteobacteria bacterium]
YANLQKSDITGGAKAQGAIFLIANLEGADLTGAQLQYADFSSSFMQGITLEHAQLQGANLRDADLDSAYMRRARLQGADMTGANLIGADIRQAMVWQTLPPKSDRLRLADMGGLSVRPLDDNERQALLQTVDSIADERLRRNVRDSLAGLLDLTKSASWRETNNAKIWDSLKSIERPGIVTNYGPELTAHLLRMSCRASWPNSAVAQGVVRRALNSQFEADMGALYAGLSQETCAGGQNIEAAMKAAMASAVEFNQQQHTYGAAAR